MDKRMEIECVYFLLEEEHWSKLESEIIDLKNQTQFHQIRTEWVRFKNFHVSLLLEQAHGPSQYLHYCRVNKH